MSGVQSLSEAEAFLLTDTQIALFQETKLCKILTPTGA